MRSLGDGLARVAATTGLAMLAAGCASEPQEEPGLAGCYELVEDPWSDQRVPWTSRFAPPGDVPPRAFRLDLPTAPDDSAAAPAPQQITVEAVPGWPPVANAVTGARPIGDSLALWWTTGFAGVMLRLAPDSTGLSGRAQGVDDHGRDSGSTPVTYRRADCADLDFDPLDWACTRSWCEDFR